MPGIVEFQKKTKLKGLQKNEVVTCSKQPRGRELPKSHKKPRVGPPKNNHGKALKISRR